MKTEDTIALPICADGEPIGLGDKFELENPKPNQVRVINRVRSITYRLDSVADEVAIRINDYISPESIRHAFEDSYDKIYNDICYGGGIDYDEFKARLAECIAYEQANAGLFTTHDALFNAVE